MISAKLGQYVLPVFIQERAISEARGKAIRRDDNTGWAMTHHHGNGINPLAKTI